jgi:predicted nucleic acid-binding protein
VTTGHPVVDAWLLIARQAGLSFDRSASRSLVALTLAELAGEPHLATSSPEGARRQARLQQLEATLEPIPFDPTAARSYGQVVAAAVEAGRSHRRPIADPLIAAIGARQRSCALHA